MRRVVSLLAAAFLFTLPGLAHAQAAAAAPAPGPAKVTITPYGFILVQGFWNDGPFAARDGGFQALNNGDGGAFELAARGSRLGFRIGMPQDPWTGADVKGVLEFDFKAGQLPSTTTASTTCSGTPQTCTTSVTLGAPSTAWYNGVPRVRLAYMTAAWGTPDSKFTILAGQDWGLIAPLSATSLAWGYDPLFWQAGNTWRRSPQLKATYEFGTTLGGSLAVSALAPADGFITGAEVFNSPYTADYGSGNRSRVPNFEGRAAVWMKSGNAKLFELGISGHYDKRRYGTSASGVTVDTEGKVVAADLQINVPYLTIQGEAFLNDGAGDTINSIAAAAYVPAAGLSSITNIQSRGFWVQAVLKPIPGVQIPVGYGTERLRDPTGFSSAGLRTANYEFSGGVLLNTSNPWKFGFEVLHSISHYDFATTAPQAPSANQYALTTKLDF